MFLISKHIRDPKFPIPGATTGQTVGFRFYTPKYWSCRSKKWDTENHPSLPEWYTQLQREQKSAHSSCRWPYRHRSYTGHAYFHGPKRRYVLHYMVPRFSVTEHFTYTRWFDNGPQPEKTDEREVAEMSAMLRATTDRHAANGCLFMQHKFAECICDPQDAA